MNRKARIELVKQTLRNYPDTRNNQKELLLMVWITQCQEHGVCLCPTHIRKYCSSPTGVDRDRRRSEVLKEFPRDEAKYESFKEYQSEFSGKLFNVDNTRL